MTMPLLGLEGPMSVCREKTFRGLLKKHPSEGAYMLLFHNELWHGAFLILKVRSVADSGEAGGGSPTSDQALSIRRDLDISNAPWQERSSEVHLRGVDVTLGMANQEDPGTDGVVSARTMDLFISFSFSRPVDSSSRDDVWSGSG
jgi:hypothetical protein